MLSLLLACTGAVDDDQNPNGGDDTGADVETTLAPEPAPYDGDCPDISGDFTIETSAGQSRDLKVVLPDNPEGAPVVFAWHPLGGTASYAISAFGLDDLAAEGWVVIAPETASGSDKPAFEWGFVGDPDMGAADLAVFDDTLSCLYQQHNIDLDRVYASGFSAGGMMTAYLALNRSQHLAAIAPYSGGTGAILDYETPEHTLPTLLVWGGSSDIWNGVVNFHDAATDFSERLQDDGHFVIECDHGGGHTVSPSVSGWTADFFLDHPYGTVDTYADGLPDSFPSYCEIP